MYYLCRCVFMRCASLPSGKHSNVAELLELTVDLGSRKQLITINKMAPLIGIDGCELMLSDFALPDACL